MDYQKPIPIPSPESEEFWLSCRKNELRLQRCSDCNSFWFPPAIICPECLSSNWGWQELSGKGKVFSFVILHRAYHQGFSEEMPYCVGLIELAEGPRLISNVVNCELESIYCGMPVEVVFEKINEEFSLPKFQFVKKEGRG